MTSEEPGQYKSQSARDACATGYGGKSYWDYLDQAAQESHDYYRERGETAMADKMLTRSLAESLMGNEGD